MEVRETARVAAGEEKRKAAKNGGEWETRGR